MSSLWKELLGNFGRCVRGAVLVSTDGQVLKSTLPAQDLPVLDTQSIAAQTARQNHQIDIKTDNGWILAAPLNKQHILVVVIDCGPYTRFNLDPISLFADNSASDDDSRLVDPTIIPQPPKRDGTKAVPEFDED